MYPRDDQVSETTGPQSHGTRSPSASSPPSPSQLSLSSVQVQPTLTPRETPDLDFDDTLGAAENHLPGHRKGIGLEEDERGWFDAERVYDDAGEEARSVETTSLASSTTSEHALDPNSSWPWRTRRALLTKRMGYPRSSSLPPKAALDSELTLTLLSSSEPSTSAFPQEKWASFEDNNITSGLVLRRSNIGSSQLRRRSAQPDPPSHSESFASLNTDHSSRFGSGQSESLAEREKYKLRGFAATVSIFEEVVDELVDVAGENADQPHHRRQDSDEVYEATREDEENETSPPDADSLQPKVRISGSNRSNPSNLDIVGRSAAVDRTATDHETCPELHRCSSVITIHRYSSADEDVDKSVAAMHDRANTMASSESNDENLSLSSRAGRCTLVEDEEPEWKSPSLGPVAEEESESSSDTVRITKPLTPDTQFERRISDSQTYPSVISEQHGEIKRRRASMSDFCAIKSILKLSPKAGRAGTVVTACSVRPADSAKPDSIYGHMDTDSRGMAFEHQSIHTAHTVRSNNGVLQML